jgi:hypothetical protein
MVSVVVAFLQRLKGPKGMPAGAGSGSGSGTVTFWVPEAVLAGVPSSVAVNCTVPGPATPDVRGTVTSCAPPASSVRTAGEGAPTETTVPVLLAVRFQGPELDAQLLLTRKRD